MNLIRTICARAFGHPTGMAGRLGGLIMARENRRMTRHAIRLLDVHPADRVLEVGFGPGVGIQLLAQSSRARVVIGIDPSTEMLDQARTRNAAPIAAGKVALWQGSVEGLPFADDRFDKALVIRSIQLWPDALAGLREIRRVLRPDGCIVLGASRSSEARRDGLAELLAAAGFVGAQVVATQTWLFALAAKPRAGASVP